MLLAAGSAACGQAATGRPEPRFVSGSKPDQAEGGRILREFRRLGIAGDYWLSFRLTVFPRRGPERTIDGEMYGTRVEAGPLSRLQLREGAGDRRWLIAGGPEPRAWVREGAEARALPPAETLAPLAATDLTLFDLQMPFLYWTDYVYEGLARVRGRPAHQFLLYPPAPAAGGAGNPAAVRVFVDTQYQALTQAETLAEGGVLEKTVTVLDLKKADDQWLVKSIDVRNHRTRDKTRLTVTAAALHLALPADLFAPAQLAAEAPPPPAAAIQRL